MKKLGQLLLLLAVVSCNTFVLDPSMPALEANDVTLINGCGAVPSGGFDACRFTEGTSISSNWVIIVPYDEKYFLGGQITVHFKDQQKSYPITNHVVIIPWKDLLSSTTWSMDHNGLALALGELRLKDDQGIERLWLARGEARILVLKQGYAPIAVDSGFTTWTKEFKCKVGYSTAGRSWIRCNY